MTNKHKPIVAYKLFKLRKNGTIGSLFIHPRDILPIDSWVEALDHSDEAKRKGMAERPGWHCCSEKRAPHLTEKGRVWAKVLIKDVSEHKRPESQGGLWYTSKWMKILEVYNERSKTN